jgi:hypothetical protein
MRAPRVGADCAEGAEVERGGLASVEKAAGSVAVEKDEAVITTPGLASAEAEP